MLRLVLNHRCAARLVKTTGFYRRCRKGRINFMGGSQELHQFQSAAIRTEAALTAGASGRKPVLYPAAGDSLWRKRVAGHTPCRRAPCIADLLAMRETPPDHRSRAQSAQAAAYPH